MCGRPKWRGERAGDRALAARRGAVDGDDHARAQRVERGKEAGKAGRRRRSCRRPLSARGAWRPATAKAIAMRWSRRGVDRRAAGERGAAAAVDDEASPRPRPHADRAQPAAIAAIRSNSLRRSSARPRSAASCRAAKAAATARIGYSSIIRGAISGGTSTPVERAWRTTRSATGSPECSRAVREGDVARPSRAARRYRPVRRRIDADALDPDRRARHDQRGDGEEGGGRGIAGDRERRCGLSSASPRSAIAVAVDRRSPRRTGAASARDGRGSAALSTTSVMPGVLSAGEQQRRFDLRRGDGRAGGASGRRAGALDRQRQARRRRSARRSAAAAPRRGAIGRRDERGVAGELGADRMAGDQAHEQPRRRARIAAVERRRRLEQAADADARRPSRRRPPPRSIRAPIAPQRRGGGGDVGAVVQPLDPALAHRQRGEDQRAVGDRLVAGDARRFPLSRGGASSAGL